MASEPKKFRAEEPAKGSVVAESIKPNAIQVRVENMKDLPHDVSNGVKSEVKRIDGFPWQLKAYYLGRRNAMVAIECKMSEESELWECEVEGKVKLINHTDDSLSMRKEFKRNFTTSINDIVFMKCDDESFVNDGCVTIEAELAVKGVNGCRFRTKPLKLDFFSPSKYSDVILSVEGNKLHVSKQILAHASPFFEALFFGSFKESEEKEIVLKDISAEDLITTLELIYDTAKIDVGNVECLLRVADRFDIPKIMIAAEEWLIFSSDLPFHFQLLLSDQYNLSTLQTWCLDSVNSNGEATEVANSFSFHHFSSELKDRVDCLLSDKQGTGAIEGDNSEYSSVIRCRVENVKDLSMKGKYSEEKRINGFPWNFNVYRGEEHELIVLVLCNKSQECPLWECKVEGEIKLINHNDDTDSICMKFKKSFQNVKRNYYSDDCYNAYVCEWDDLIGDQNFVIDGSIDVEVMIKVKGRSGDRFRKKPQMPSFLSPSNFSDVVFLIEGKRIYASKQILAHASLHFEKRFYGDLKENEEKEIVLDDVSTEEFVICLEMIYDTLREIGDDDMESILVMADRFEITMLLVRAERWLINWTELPLHLKLCLADQYDLEVLKIQCLRQINDFEDVEELRDSESYDCYSHEIKDELINKMLSFSRYP